MNKFYLSTFVFYFFCLSIFCQNQNIKDPILEKANTFKFKNQDSALFYLNKGYKLRIKEKDTLKAINSLLELSNLHSHNLNYEKAYDGYWKALFLAEQSKDSLSISNSYLGLGLMYSYYNRNTDALKHFDKALIIKKKLIKHKVINLDYLSINYFSILSLHRMNNDLEQVGVYLDSMRLIKKKDTFAPKGYYFESEEGYHKAITGDLKNGLAKLNKAKDYFSTKDPSYLVVIHALIGDIYKQTENHSESIKNYLTSLNHSIEYNSHLNYRLIAYESLYKLYAKDKQYEKASKYLLYAKELSENLYGINHSKNQNLFEIKDKHRIEIEKKEKLLKEKRIAKLEHEDKIWLMKSIILGVTIVFLILFGYSFIKMIRNRHKNEKAILKERQILNTQKHKEIIELKNKELTESALRLIEKDEFITSIKKRLTDKKGSIDVNIIKRIIRQNEGSSLNNWSEFEARFTTINQSFYEDLKNSFPNFKQTDLKICALIKLNFSSKDMARLLGISVDSVHTLRHRVRKKLNLQRSQNLEEYINNL